MLTELTIRNFAIIDEVKINFARGLNIVTGETGAGKSIIIGAVALLLGDKASVDLIRTGEETAQVEALFNLRDSGKLTGLLTEWGMDEGEEVVIKRIVSRSGKSRAYVNGHPVTMAMLARLGEELVSICGQHEHQRLSVEESHLEYLDTYAGLVPVVADYTAFYHDVNALKTRIDTLREKKRNRQQAHELLSFQLKEIDELHPQPGEDVALEEEKRVLLNSRRLQELAISTYDALYGDEGAALQQIKKALEAVSEISKIDTRLPISLEEIQGLYYQLEDMAFTVRDYGKSLHFDAQRLEEIEDRLEHMGRLKKKYGGSIPAILARREEITAALVETETVEEELERLEGEWAEKLSMLEEKARELSKRRKEAATQLARDMNVELQTLRMEGARFHIAFEISDLHERGMDKVEFLFSANPGEELKPLRRVASGGELSRVILAFKKVLADKGFTGTIIFDEVDSGIGGATAEVVGEKIEEVAKYNQVICITHLSQIARFGQRHYRVEKHVTGGKTVTDVKMLTAEERRQELARMLAGKKISETTLKHAAELLADKPGMGEG